ncbi:MAG: glycosyltransferase [Hahellaceae bacterium]|nr:glycosyltransferase [Hahellaceae bacterium]MCP5211746.1 glycosyltransferase [Hahellaceae bacterium]
MKVSVVIPCYNLGQYIVECLDSILRQQTDFDFEVIVRDDASSDHSQAVLGKYLAGLSKKDSTRLKLLLGTFNLGLVGNLAEIFTHCQGEYIAYLDGDDVALPGKLQKQVDYLDRHPDCAIVYHESEVFDSDTGNIRGAYSRDFYNAKYIPAQAHISDLVKYGTFLQASAVMYRRHQHLEKILDPAIQIIVDYPMHMFNAYFAQGSIDRMDEVLGKYRVHPQSFGAQTGRSAERRERVLSELCRACDNALSMGVAEADVRAGKWHFTYAAALYFLRMGEVERFLKHIEASTDEQWFFDEKHRLVYEHRTHPAEIIARVFS